MRTVNIVINPKYPQLGDFANRLSTSGVPDGATQIYRGRNRIYEMPVNGIDLNIKAFRVPGSVKSLIYGAGKSKASRSYENSLELERLGFNVAEPLAYIEIHEGPRLLESYYLSRQLHARDVRCWENLPDNRPLVDAVAKELASLHKAGVWHKDFSPGNVLYTGDAANGYKIYLIDVNRMRFGVKSQRLLMDNFRAINIVPEETEKLARMYAAHMGLNPDTTARKALGVLKRFLRKKDILHGLKRLIKPHKEQGKQ